MANKDLKATEYSEKSFWQKVGSAAKKAGSETIYHALVLFYVFKSPDTPMWCKGVIIGALAYFISLVDGIPDLTPFFGYTDDLSVIMAAIGTISSYITPEIEEKARLKTQSIFGENS